MITNKTEKYENYNNFLKNYKYNLIIIKDNNIDIFNNNFDTYIIMIYYENDFYPLYNLMTKHFKNNSNIIEYILASKNKNIIKNEKNEKDEYLELQTNDECELSITELDEKKTVLSKFSKDIFIPHKNTSNTDNNVIKSTNSIENKKKELIKNTKITLSIKQLQDIATELNVPLTFGNLKNGNPKYRTKQELFEDIKNCKL
jgi:hypothetical protein